MEGKKVKNSHIVMTQVMTVLDANNQGNVHGGVIMRMIDNAAGVVATRHARTNVVTASVDRIDFHFPVHIGDLVTVKASLNLVGKSSMEVGVKVEAESLTKGTVTHTASAYLTMVALENGKPAPVPPLILETEDEKRRNRQAQARREVRLREKRSESGSA